MFNYFLNISPFIYGGSFIFAILLMRFKCYKYVIFPAYIVFNFVLIHSFYAGSFSELEFKIYTIFLSVFFSLFLLVSNFKTKELFIMLSPTLAIFIIFFADLYHYLLLFYFLSVVSVIAFILLILREIHKR